MQSGFIPRHHHFIIGRRLSGCFAILLAMRRTRAAWNPAFGNADFTFST